MNANVQIRPHKLSDVDPIYDAVIESKRELTPWAPWCHLEYSRQDTITWVESRSGAWERNEDLSFVIIDSNDRILGNCGLYRLEPKNNVGELGYWVRSTATSQGVATEATRQLCQFGFEEAGLERIEILMSIENIASRRVAEKVGAVREGLLRERLKINGRRHDCLLYSILKHEFRR